MIAIVKLSICFNASRSSVVGFNRFDVHGYSFRAYYFEQISEQIKWLLADRRDGAGDKVNILK